MTLLTYFTEAHTLKHTCIISTQEEWRQPGTGAWLGGAEERLFVRDQGLEHSKKHCQQKRYLETKKKIEHRELPAKLLDYYLGSNKSNINQSCVIEIHRLKVSFFDCQLRRWLLLCTLFIIIYYQQIRFFRLICIPHQP